ncbi:MAG: histidine--tRNA ligase [Desulforhopalus sp.]|nr:histidine--tRNA ligase [Desulforhopalus sp.]
MKIKALKGFKDILPGEVELWQILENTARAVFEQYNFHEIRVPVLEETALFQRAIGDTTDIVEKEMYTFVDKQQTLRPEGTASLLRSVIENGLLVQKPVQRLFTIGPMFRHERPQKGRLRQFHQLDIEVIGSKSPLLDTELISLAALLFSELGINVSLELNSLGCPKCRPAYREALLAFINERKDKLCSDCQRRSETNPLRVLDCKVPEDRALMANAPSIQDWLCEECGEHFNVVQQGLERLGIPFRLNKFMVRGLDYYCRTTFEFLTSDLGAQAAVAAGGRYDGLVELLGGPAGTPGIGFAMGMERIVLLMQQSGQDFQESIEPLDIYIAGLGDHGQKEASRLAWELRQDGFSVGLDYEGRSLKAQMKLANRENATFVFIIGDDELALGKGVLRNMRDRDAEQMELELKAEAFHFLDDLL